MINFQWKRVDYIREKFEDNKFEHFAMLYATAVNLKHNDLKKFINFYLSYVKNIQTVVLPAEL